MKIGIWILIIPPSNKIYRNAEEQALIHSDEPAAQNSPSPLQERDISELILEHSLSTDTSGVSSCALRIP